MFYIYIILNKLNGHFYVGKSSNPTYRFIKHKTVANNIGKNTSHKAFPIHYAIKKYGEENFEIHVIDEMGTNQDILLLEKHWISYFKPTYTLYNATNGGDEMPRNCILSEEDVLEIKFLLNNGCPQRILGKIYGVSRFTILSIKNGKNWNHIILKNKKIKELIEKFNTTNLKEFFKCKKQENRSKAQLGKTAWNKGKVMTEEIKLKTAINNGSSKLEPFDIIKIRKLLQNKSNSIKIIAKIYNVSKRNNKKN